MSTLEVFEIRNHDMTGKYILIIAASSGIQHFSGENVLSFTFSEINLCLWEGKMNKLEDSSIICKVCEYCSIQKCNKWNVIIWNENYCPY